MLFVLNLNAQTEKNISNSDVLTPVDSVEQEKVDTVLSIEEELKIQHKFGVYTRSPRKPDNRMKLCINLVSAESMLEVCVNDSILKYPETSKILFEKNNGDSTYVLVLVDAFTKVNDKPACDAGKETKLFFIRWNTETNKAVWKQRTISSCLKAITNMTKEHIVNWDGGSPLIINYHRGSNNFIELKFDPQNYLAGLQSVSDTGN